MGKGVFMNAAQSARVARRAGGPVRPYPTWLSGQNRLPRSSPA